MKRFALALLFALFPTLAFGQANWGDYQTNHTIVRTVNTVGSDSVAETLVSEEVVVVKDGATVLTTGISIDDDVSLDFGGGASAKTGLHKISIDLTTTGYDDGDYDVVYKAGTVDSIDVARRVLATFSVGRYADITVTGGVADVNVVKVSGDATAADNAESFFDGTGYAGTGNTIPTVTNVTNGVNVTQFGGNNGTFSAGRPEVNATHWGGTAVGSASVRANVIQFAGTTFSETASGNVATNFATFFDNGNDITGVPTLNSVGTIGTGGITTASFAAGAIDAAAIATDAITASEIAANAIGSSELASDAITAGEIADDAINAASITSDAIAEIADGVWDELLSGHTGSGTPGQALSWMKNAFTSSGVFSSGALANSPTGEAIVDETAADLIAARVNASRGDFYPNAKQVWVLKRDGAGLEVKNDFQITMGEGETLKVWIDFASVVGKNEFIQSIDSLELSGGSAVIVTDSSGILGNLVYLQVEGGIDGDATTVDFEVTTTAGQVITGSVCVFNVVE